MQNRNSLDRIVSYFHALANTSFVYNEVKINPYAMLKVNSLAFRSYTCPSDCGACCMKCSLVWFDKTKCQSALERIVTVNNQTISVYIDEQVDNLGNKCKHLDENARCRIYMNRPLPCALELWKFIHYVSRDCVYGRVAMPGRHTRLTRINGMKGAQCNLGAYNAKQTQEIITLLKRIGDWMDVFKIQHDVQDVVQYLETGPHQEALVIRRIK